MPPDALPPDDAREPDAHDANVVDPEVLAERRAQRAEHAERSATRRAADAQSLAADLARERARLEAERDAARAEAAAAREGADAVKAEARNLQAERDALRVEVQRGEVEREALRAEIEQVRGERAHAPGQVAASVSAPPADEVHELAPDEGGAALTSDEADGEHAPHNGNGAALPAAWATGLRRELAVARAATTAPIALAPSRPASRAMPSLARERDLVARRSADGPSIVETPLRPGRSGERATPLTALALERERSGRLRAELERAVAVERELRAQLAALEQAVQERRDAERRIETALQRVRSEFDAARALAAEQQQAPVAVTATEAAPVGPPLALPALPATLVVPDMAEPRSVAGEQTTPPGLDAERLDAAQARLRAIAAVEQQDESAAPIPPPVGPPAPWLAAALRRLLRDDPRTVGRLITALLPAQGLVTQRALHYDLVLAGRGCIGVDVGDEGTVVRPREQPRPRREVDFRLTTDEEGLARLLLARRGRRRGARVRGSRRRVKELRRLTSDPLALRDLASAGAMLDPVLAFSLAALAVDPSATYGHRFTIAHVPLAGGPADAWLRVQNGGPLAVVRTRPGETPALTIRSTRGALLPLLAGIAPPPGEAAALDGDTNTLALLRGWIARTEFPAG